MEQFVKAPSIKVSSFDLSGLMEKIISLAFGEAFLLEIIIWSRLFLSFHTLLTTFLFFVIKKKKFNIR